VGDQGRTLALSALSGQPTPRIPAALFTWGFDYTWKTAGIPPWQLARGGAETWHRAHVALVERHRPDVIWYEGAGAGPKEPSLLDETRDAWIIRDNNTNEEYELVKNSLSLRHRQTGTKSCDPVGAIESTADADRRIGLFTGWGEHYLAGLRRLIDEVGDRALVLPHHSPAYICTCYAFGFERAMEVMLSEPKLFRYVCDRYAVGDRLRMREWKSAGAQACFIADGWASCDIISPDLFKKFALPYQRAIIEAAHAEGLKIILWNEGDILPILDLEAALETDGFAFEQPRKGFEVTVAKVRKAFGSNRCLFGNVDSELLLMRNDPDEIARAVREQTAQSGSNAPFILSTGSPIPSNVDVSAVDTMIRSLSI